MKRWMVSVLASMLCLLVVMGCNRGGCGCKRSVDVEVPEVSALDELRIEIADLKIAHEGTAERSCQGGVQAEPC